ncbi:hypothetical protein ER57_11605 [Smithella sp. SCADC]|jgi:predicted nucleotidyltransferase component of viral defense system|nr:hypothetical protein ER57_11605 [Smithella sp. SCADC]HAR49436.1 nucleotidyl transferase AbiEii/AbiGii toxin family protein [Smithella sp.]
MNDLTHLKEWLKLSDQQRLNIYTETGKRAGLPAFVIEKDWWAVHILALIFSMECASALVFKGGTSLSKGWNLIQRFSEDIDLALNREYLGFKGMLSAAAIRKLRRKSYEFLTTVFVQELRNKFTGADFAEVTVKVREVKNHDQDPVIIEIYYPKLTEQETYLKPGVLLEIGSRSLTEPFTHKYFGTLVAENFSEQPFADKPVNIPTVNPERTFLEKIFLLHEEFQRPQEKMRVDRLSRHLYDIEKLSRTEFAEKALRDAQLYQTIVEHRRLFNSLPGLDYANHSPDKIRFIPPDALLGAWENDYQQMRENMIYAESLIFAELIGRLAELQARINRIKW